MKNKNWNKKFNDFLQKNNIRTKEASAKTKIPYSTMRAYLNGSRSPSDTNKEIIKKKLNFDILKAMYGDLNDKN